MKSKDKWEAKVKKGEEWFADERNAGREYKSHRFVPTADDWYPCYFLDENGKEIKYNQEEPWEDYAARCEKGAPMVLGTVYLTHKFCLENKCFVRIHFWGNDDTGIEMDQTFDTLEDGMEAYDRGVKWLTHLAVACYHDLLRLGFKHA